MTASASAGASAAAARPYSALPYRTTRLLIRHGASLLAEELLEAVDGDDEAQDHQQDGKDELQALGGGDGDGGRGGGSRDGTEETVGLDGGHAAHGALDQRGEGAAEQEDDGT